MQAKTIKINSKVFPFTTAEEASKLYMKLRAKGLSHTCFARLLDERGVEVGCVSPNGNVFDHPVSDWQNPAAPIFQSSLAWSAKA